MKVVIFMALLVLTGSAIAENLVVNKIYRLNSNISNIDLARKPDPDNKYTALRNNVFQVMEVTSNNQYLVRFVTAKESRPDNIPDTANLVEENELYLVEKDISAWSLSNYTKEEKFGQIEVYAYVGQVFDNFASANVNDYLNANDSGETKTRETFGVWFQYPLWNDSFWIYGQTAHGVRSSDIDCKANSDLSVCKDSDFADEIADPRERALFMLRSSSSLEAMLGFRYEFTDLQKGDSRAYISYQKGFITVESGDGDASEISRFSLGIRIAKGKYRNSFLEFAEKGKNELFAENKDDRLQINARLTREFTLAKSYVVPGFIHFSGDFDDGDGSDAIQTYVGIALKFN